MEIFTTTKHISEEALGLFALNDLPESRRKVVAGHLFYCNQCREQLKEAQELVDMLRLVAKKHAAPTLGPQCGPARCYRPSA
jgi:predicted anti-sigma-YlaC factor YlaD